MAAAGGVVQESAHTAECDDAFGDATAIKHFDVGRILCKHRPERLGHLADGLQKLLLVPVVLLQPRQDVLHRHHVRRPFGTLARILRRGAR